MPTHILTNSQDDIILGSNAYFDGTNWRYKSDGLATRIVVDSIGLHLDHAASGSADATITWIEDFEIQAYTGVMSMGAGIDGSYLRLQVNSSTQQIKVGGVLHVNALAQGNVGTGEDVLVSKTVLADTMKHSGETIVVEAWGKTANNANTKTLRVNFGASGTKQVMSRAMTVSVANKWYIKCIIGFRTNTSQQAVSIIHDGTAVEVQHTDALNQTLTSSVVLEVTGQATADNDIVLEGSKMYFDHSNF